MADFTRTQNATSLWSARYGLTYSTYFRNPMEPFDLTTLGFPQVHEGQLRRLSVFPTIAPEGYTDIGTEGWVVMDRQEGVHQLSRSSDSKFIGGHSIKFGRRIPARTSSTTRSRAIRPGECSFCRAGHRKDR